MAGVEPVEGASHCYVSPFQHIAVAWALGPSCGQRSCGYDIYDRRDSSDNRPCRMFGKRQCLSSSANGTFRNRSSCV